MKLKTKTVKNLVNTGGLIAGTLFLAVVLTCIPLSLGKNKQKLEADKIAWAQKKGDTTAYLRSYEHLRTEIQSKRKTLYQKYTEAGNPKEQKVIEQARGYLFFILREKLFPYWYGTAWSYSGTSSTPGRGKIACGYFISTVLQHAGFRVQRYELAQQPASIIMRTLCTEKSIKVFENVENLRKYLHKKQDGLYIIGLDKHVGFLEMEKLQNNIYIIHAAENPGQVIKERVGEAETIAQSDLFFIGNFLANDAIIKKWLTQQKIQTVD